MGKGWMLILMFLKNSSVLALQDSNLTFDSMSWLFWEDPKELRYIFRWFYKVKFQYLLLSKSQQGKYILA